MTRCPENKTLHHISRAPYHHQTSSVLYPPLHLSAPSLPCAATGNKLGWSWEAEAEESGGAARVCNMLKPREAEKKGCFSCTERWWICTRSSALLSAVDWDGARGAETSLGKPALGSAGSHCCQQVEGRDEGDATASGNVQGLHEMVWRAGLGPPAFCLTHVL